MRIGFLFAAALTALLFNPLARPAGGIVWEASFDEALAKAKAENKPIFIAVNMDGEWVCEDLARNHYRDKRIVQLSEKMVNLFASKFYHRGGTKTCPRAGNIRCSSHQEVEKEVRRLVLGMKGEEGNTVAGDMIAPNHIFLSPDGKITHSVAYMITPGELEWCLVEAIRKNDPGFKWSLRSSARAPRRLVYDKVTRPGGGGGGSAPRPLSGDELDAVLEEIKTTGRGNRGGGLRRNLASLIVTPDKRAMEVVRIYLTSRWIKHGGGQRLCEILHDIGRTSPPEFWEVVEPFVSDSLPDVRSEAIVALEQLAEPKSVKLLQKQWSKEKEKRVKWDLIRALASTGRGVKRIETLVLKTAEKEKDGQLRAHAIVGLVYIEDREKVNAVLEKALTHEHPPVRAAAAYTIAVRRERDLLEPLTAAREAELDSRLKLYMKASCDALGEASLDDVVGILVDYLLDKIVRDRE